jgi:AcrR family transcriptional regulator
MTSQRHTPLAEAEAMFPDRGPPDRELPEPILAATRATVLAVGVRRTTLTDVARRAGVSRMTLYRLVPDVSTLVLAVMTREFAALLAEAEAAVRRKRTGRGRLAAAAVEVARRLPEEPLFRRVLDVDPELLLPYLTDRLGATQRLAIGHVRRMVADGMADGSVRRADPDLLATVLVLAVTPFVVSARLFDASTRTAALAEIERLVDRWLAPDGARA